MKVLYLLLETNFHHGETKLINLGECEGSNELAFEKASRFRHIGFGVFGAVVKIDNGQLRHLQNTSVNLLPEDWGLYICSDGIEEEHF